MKIQGCGQNKPGKAPWPGAGFDDEKGKRKYKKQLISDPEVSDQKEGIHAVQHVFIGFSL